MQTFAANVVLWMGLSLGIGASAAVAATPPPDSPLARLDAEQLDRLPPVAPWGTASIDHSGRGQKGHASYYAAKFAHRKMAGGNHMNPQANVAASKSLPLGTTAKVINLQNGKSVTVRVEDRGPFVAGRLMDVTFKVAQELEMSKNGVVPVEVKPIVVPKPDGEVELRCRRGRSNAARSSSDQSCLNASIEPFSSTAWGRLPPNQWRLALDLRSQSETKMGVATCRMLRPQPSDRPDHQDVRP